MATRIIEFTGVDPSVPAAALVPADKRTATQTAIATTTSPANSATFATATGAFCVQCDEATYVDWGPSPGATVNHYRIQAGQEQFFIAVPGAGWKVSVRQ